MFKLVIFDGVNIELFFEPTKLFFNYFSKHAIEHKTREMWKVVS